MVDHQFRFSGSPHAGRQVVRVVNAGSVNHEFRLEHVLSGHTSKESLEWTPAKGTPPPDEDAGAAATLPAGGAITLIYDLPPGDYTVFCVPQIAHGMKTAFHVSSSGDAHAAPAR
jgi:plastocyanin